jgi:hypothetical protein
MFPMLRCISGNLMLRLIEVGPMLRYGGSGTAEHLGRFRNERRGGVGVKSAIGASEQQR